jgi:hypothetical protein
MGVGLVRYIFYGMGVGPVQCILPAAEILPWLSVNLM